MPWPRQHRSDEPQQPAPGSPPAWARPQQSTSDEAYRALATAVAAFANTTSWEALWRVLTERQQLLLTDQTEIFLQKLVQLDANNTDPYLQQRLQIIHDCRAKGIAATKAAYEHAQTRILIPSLYQAIQDFVNARDDETLWRILNERQQLLLNDEAVRELQLNADDHPDFAELIRARLTIIKYCREKGIDAYKQTMVGLAFEALINAKTWDEIWNVMTERQFWLFTDMLDDLMQRLPESNPDLFRQLPSLAKTVPQRLTFVRDSRTIGVPAARAYNERKPSHATQARTPQQQANDAAFRKALRELRASATPPFADELVAAIYEFVYVDSSQEVEQVIAAQQRWLLTDAAENVLRTLAQRDPLNAAVYQNRITILQARRAPATGNTAQSAQQPPPTPAGGLQQVPPAPPAANPAPPIPQAQTSAQPASLEKSGSSPQEGGETPFHRIMATALASSSPPIPNEVIDGIEQLMYAGSQEDAERIIRERRQWLLTDTAERALQTLIQRDQDQGRQEGYRQRLGVIRYLRDNDVPPVANDADFQRLLQQIEAINIANERQRIPRKIALLHAAIAYLTKTGGDRQRLAALQFDLGFALCLGGAGEAGMKEAIDAYRAALQVYTREAYPDKWEYTMSNLGNALRLYTGGDRRQNLQEAIQVLNLVLQAAPREANPNAWAANQMNLGYALRDLSALEQSGNG